MAQQPSRRGEERAAFDGWVELGGNAGRRLGRALNLSTSGLGVSLAAPHPEPGVEMESEFALPGFVLPLSLPAEVAWNDPAAGRIGLRFRGVEPAVAELLANFVAGRL